MSARTPITINICSIPVKGIGGLGMLGVVLLMAAAIPAARWLLIGSVVAGAVGAALFIRRGRDHVIGTPDGSLPMTLGLSSTGRPAVRPSSTDQTGPGLPEFAVGY